MKEKIKISDWLFNKVKKHQTVTLTLGFLLVYRLFQILGLYSIDKNLFLELYRLNIWFFLIGIPIIYFLQWFLVTWVVSKFSKEKLKEKFYRHPFLTIILFILYLTDLPYRLSGAALGTGLGKLLNSFETIIYYAFLSFLWWLLFCWISEKIWKKQRFEWNWYKKIIDNFFSILPPIYKFILGLIIAIFIFLVLFMIISSIFHYSGADIEKLFNY